MFKYVFKTGTVIYLEKYYKKILLFAFSFSLQMKFTIEVLDFFSLPKPYKKFNVLV